MWTAGRQDQTVRDWTRRIWLLCRCARDVDKANRNHGEWLYDVTWLKYERDLGKRGLDLAVQARVAAAERKRCLLIDSHLVAECEWGNLEQIVDDFEKLLLARAGMSV